MRRTGELTRDELESVVRRIQNVLYESASSDVGRKRQEILHRDRLLGNSAADTIKQLDGVLAEYGLVPDLVVSETEERAALYWVHRQDGGPCLHPRAYRPLRR